MTEALAMLYYIYERFIQWIFTDAELFPGVTLGWILVDGSVFAMLIRSIINVPTSSRKNSSERSSARIDKE